jgi:hypothetical protein
MRMPLPGEFIREAPWASAHPLTANEIHATGINIHFVFMAAPPVLIRLLKRRIGMSSIHDIFIRV